MTEIQEQTPEMQSAVEDGTIGGGMEILSDEVDPGQADPMHLIVEVDEEAVVTVG